MIIVVLCALYAVLTSVLIIIDYKRKKNKYRKIKEAARVLIRDRRLTKGIIFNNDMRVYHRLFVYIEVMETKPRVGYVFNPETPITFGRMQTSNVIQILDRMVSRVHCRIIEYNDRIYLQDLGAKYAAYVKRRTNKYYMEEGESFELHTGDKIVISNYTFLVILLKGDEILKK